MRLEINLTSQEKISLPQHYNYLFESFVYNILDPHLREFLHNYGFTYQKRKFKFFCFSRLFGNFEKQNETIIFDVPVKFFLSSPKKEILQSLAEGLLNNDKLFLGKNKIFIESIKVLPKLSATSELTIKMLSPITIYSTQEKSNGNKWTQYYSPFDEKFSYLIAENLRKKYIALYGKEITEINFKIAPYKVKPSDKKVILYKKHDKNQSKPTVIEAWLGLYKIEGNPELIELSYDCGLGSKNSQGFGMWDVYGRG